MFARELPSARVAPREPREGLCNRRVSAKIAIYGKKELRSITSKLRVEQQCLAAFSSIEGLATDFQPSAAS